MYVWGGGVGVCVCGGVEWGCVCVSKTDTQSDKNVQRLSERVPPTRPLAPRFVNHVPCGKRILLSENCEPFWVRA